MHRCRLIACALAGSLLFTACGTSSSAKRDTTTTTPGKSFQLQTDDGQASLSLDGQLPPGWPSSFPVPSGASAAGSGSLVDDASGAMVAVYTTSQAPADVYDFYKTSTSLTIGKTASVGVGSSYVGSLQLEGRHRGSVTIVSRDGETTIVVVLKATSAATTTTG